MCTLILLHRCVGGAPLVVAANRDEYLDRPAAGPGVLETGGVRVVAPRDLRAGGTWLGVSEHGLFAGLTNRPTARPDPARRSRGLLVTEALREPDAETAAKRLQSLPPAAYNPFQLVLADAERAFAVVYDETPRLLPLAPGVHVVGNADPDDASAPKVARLLERARAVDRCDVPSALRGLAELCRDHGAPAGAGPLGAPCIHTPAYGTRSSTLLALAEREASDVLLFAESAPCTSAYDDRSTLLASLGRATARAPGDHPSRSDR